MNAIDIIIPISVALGLSVIHFIGEKISERMRKWHHHLESLGAGLMIGILFLELLPHIVSGHDTALGFYIYIPLLAGFTIIALIEKIVYKRILKLNPASPIKPHSQDHGSKEEIIAIDEYEKNLTDIECIVPEQNSVFEAIAYITHSLMIGILIALIFYENESNLEVAFLIMIPFVLRAFTVAFSAEQIMEDLPVKSRKFFRILSFLTLIIGALIGVFLVLNVIVFYVFFAFALGLVLFTVIRDLIPLGKKGKPVFFLIGVVFTMGIFLLNELAIH
ncbi:MAG: hypothetical protein ACTSO7_03315 [Candidatus Heimdallarchaeota archaeon]